MHIRENIFLFVAIQKAIFLYTNTTKISQFIIKINTIIKMG